MNKLLILLAAVALFSCSSKNGYEKAIADFVQTDKKGTFYDMKFKALEIAEHKRLTVADSVTFLKQQAEGKLMQAWHDDYLKYEGRAQDEVLAIVVRCKYSLVPPTMNTTITETKDFVFSPDGIACLRMVKAE